MKNSDRRDRRSALIGDRNKGGMLQGAYLSADDCGMMTLEASIIIPLILFIVAGSILLFIAQGRREELRGEMIKALYTIPVEKELDEDPRNEVAARAEGIMNGTSTVGLSAASSGKKLGLEGNVIYNGIGGYGGTLPAAAGRDKDLCSKRLRRWQFYGDLAEN